MRTSDSIQLTRRERQIMDVLYLVEAATAAEIQERLPGSPSYSTVRALLKKLVDKHHVTYREDGPRYVYLPVVPKDEASESALSRLLDTFFDGSAGAAVVNLLGRQGKELSAEELAEIEDQLKRLQERRR